MTECYHIIKVDQAGKITSSYGKIYFDKKEITLKLAKLQVKEYEELVDSIDAETFMDDAKEEREEADKALNDFFFDSKFGLKLYSTDHETKYHVPENFQILTLELEDKDDL